MTDPSSNINVTFEEESKGIIMHKTLSENSSTDVRKWERNIINETLLQNNSANLSENTITELKDEEHKEPSVTEKVKSYFNIYKCGRNLLDRLDVTYQREFKATPTEKYYNALLDTLIKDKSIRGET